MTTYFYSYRESARGELQHSAAFDAAEACETARQEFIAMCGGERGVDGGTVDGTWISEVQEEA